jgi:hypothetical protein
LGRNVQLFSRKSKSARSEVISTFAEASLSLDAGMRFELLTERKKRQ